MTEYDVILGRGTPESLRTQTCLSPFADVTLSFLQALSGRLLRDPAYRRMPELPALGFWCRRGHISQLCRRYEHLPGVRRPRGLAFHLAPGNVDTLFVYSWVCALLLGNRSIIRLSRRSTPALEALVRCLTELLDDPEFEPIAQRLLVVRYEHDVATTQALSAHCDIRVIWGGDATIQAIRKVPLPAHAGELTFADKFSWAVLNAGAVVNSDTVGELARDFVNDAYWFGQLACSSPRLVVWVGDTSMVAAAQRCFWPAVESRLDEFNHDLSAADYMNKLATAQRLAVTHGARTLASRDNRLVRLELPLLESVPEDAHCGAGLFFESSVQELDDVLRTSTRRHQTITSYGFTAETWHESILRVGPRGVDRIVPVGRALDFDVLWDGVDLFAAFSRVVSVQIGPDA